MLESRCGLIENVSGPGKGAANVSVYVIRKDGFNSAIKLALKDAPAGITANPVTLSPTQAVVGLTVRTSLATTQEPFSLVIEGSNASGPKMGH